MGKAPTTKAPTTTGGSPPPAPPAPPDERGYFEISHDELPTYSCTLCARLRSRPGPSLMLLPDRILSAGRGIERVAERLEDLGYQFDDPAAVFPGPEPGVDAAIERIEREVGALPLAIKLFWRSVGSVNFMGEHLDWEGCEYPDPLVVYPPSVAVLELDEFLADREERLRCNYPYLIPVAPDEYHKENVSGGMYYNLTVPAVADDPPLNDERHRTTFAAYLELALRWGGFPGLDRCKQHNWPLADLTGGT
jgi:hypothetical protein